MSSVTLRPGLAVAGLGLWLAVACGGPGDAHPEGGQAPGQRMTALPSGMRGPTGTQNALTAIARCEDARTDGEGLLLLLAEQGDVRLRERAVEALGRLPREEHGEPVTRVLVARLTTDRFPAVRAAAAFALGTRGDPAAVVQLADAAQGGERGVQPEVRARAVEALSKLANGAQDREACVRVLIHALEDGNALVRGEAAIGAHRLSFAHAALDQALLDALARPLGAPDAEVLWRALFSLGRRKCALARGAFVAGLSSADDRARRYAAIGLAALPYDEASQTALYAVLDDPDWRVVVEALRAVGAHPDARSAAELERRFTHPSPHVQRVAFEAAGSVDPQAFGERSLTVRALTHESPSVWRAAFIADARLRRDGAAPAIELAAKDQDPLMRAAAAEAARQLSQPGALERLLQLAQDDDVRVVQAACEGLGALDHDAAHAKLVQLLASGDNGVRLAALEALKRAPRAADFEAVARCYDTSKGEAADEIAFNALDVAAKIAAGAKAGPTAPQPDSVDEELHALTRKFLAKGATSPSAYTRQRARQLFEATYADQPVPRAPVRAPTAAKEVPVAGVTLPVGARPRVAVETSRGTLVFELFPDETPVHVANFLALVERKFYDGTTFHRVVPDFVVQGGDRRGDGNGGASWRGDALRHEFTPRKFERGSLGMPRNDDPDSGGSQIFVCHRETPHLDGRYTLFGQLVEGQDVLDRLEIGDRIVSTRRLESKAGR